MRAEGQVFSEELDRQPGGNDLLTKLYIEFQ